MTKKASTFLPQQYTTGFEVEYGSPGLHSHELENFKNQFKYLGSFKLDATVPGGFEFASYIFDSTEFLNDGQSRFRDFFTKIAELNPSTHSNDGAGMHVHISKKAISPDRIYVLNKFLVLFQDNVRLLGERDFTGYCMPILNSKSDIFNGERAAWNNRYRILNTRKGETIEFRFFKTTANFSTFMKNMQFCFALVDFTLNVRYSEMDCLKDDLWHLFTLFVRKNKQLYKFLYKFLCTNKLITKYKEEDFVFSPSDIVIDLSKINLSGVVLNQFLNVCSINVFNKRRTVTFLEALYQRLIRTGKSLDLVFANTINDFCHRARLANVDDIEFILP